MSDPKTAPEQVIWRTTRLARQSAALATAFIGAFGVFIGLVGTSRGNVIVALVGVLIVALAGLGFWAYCVRPCIRIEGEQLVIVNPARTARVRLASIASVRPGYSGITVVYFDGAQSGKVTAWAVQKANLSTQLARTTRADIVAAAIKRRADDARVSE